MPPPEVTSGVAICCVIKHYFPGATVLHSQNVLLVNTNDVTENDQGSSLSMVRVC